MGNILYWISSENFKGLKNHNIVLKQTDNILYVKKLENKVFMLETEQIKINIEASITEIRYSLFWISIIIPGCKVQSPKQRHR